MNAIEVSIAFCQPNAMGYPAIVKGGDSGGISRNDVNRLISSMVSMTSRLGDDDGIPTNDDSSFITTSYDGEFVGVSQVNLGNNGGNEHDAPTTVKIATNESYLDCGDDIDSSIDVDDVSLDVMLNRARKRPINRLYQIQALLDAQFIRLESPWQIVFTRGDMVLLFVSAVVLDAYGFTCGLILGKITIRPLFDLVKPSPAISILLLPSWSVIWAILLDQVI